MIVMVKLKPCPYCAGPPLPAMKRAGEWFVSCGAGCKAEGPHCTDKEAAERWWNTRK